MEAWQMELVEAHLSLCVSFANITFLLETNSMKHEEWVTKRFKLQSL